MQTSEAHEIEQWFQVFDFVGVGAISQRDVFKILELMLVVVNPSDLITVTTPIRSDGLYDLQDMIRIYGEAKQQDERVNSRSLAESFLALGRCENDSITRNDFRHLNRVLNKCEFTDNELDAFFSGDTEDVYRLATRLTLTSL